jgi:hypothetical protein
MTVAPIDPHRAFAGGLYFGCREPHLPIELAVWASDPVPLFPYPTSPDYASDDLGWERAHRRDPAQFAEFSDIEEERPRHLHEREHEVQR